MKFAIITDIHANLQALEAVISDAQANQVDRFICLGDIVGYGPQPKECLEIIRDLGCPVVRGNHDHDASNDRDLSALSPDAQSSLKWTRSVLNQSDKDWLGSLPYVRRVGRFSIAHATPRRSNLFGYVHSVKDAAACLQEQEAPLCFIGHTHIPALYCQKDGMTTEVSGSMSILSSAGKYLCNPGAVGQPRDNDVRSSYIIYDRGVNMIQRRRVSYDVAKTQQLLRRCQLPASLATRLTEVA